MPFNSGEAVDQKQGDASPKKGPGERGAWSLAIYEMGVVRTVWTLFGWRKALKFLIFLPSVLAGGRNRSAYERIAPCETAIFGQKVILPHPDAGYLKEIVVDRCYTGVPGFEIGIDDVVVDLGANLGIFTLMAGLLARKGRVLAVEPEAQNYEFLRDNLKANPLPNVETCRVAILDQDGQAYLNPTAGGSSAIFDGPMESQVTQKVESISLISLFSRLGVRKVDFLKMDIEGAEFRAFKDYSWLEQVARISMEVHPHVGDVGFIIERLVRSGFVVNVAQAREGLVYLHAKRVS